MDKVWAYEIARKNRRLNENKKKKIYNTDSNLILLSNILLSQKEEVPLYYAAIAKPIGATVRVKVVCEISLPTTPADLKMTTTTSDCGDISAATIVNLVITGRDEEKPNCAGGEDATTRE
ncbi:MAG: hypothetical protein PHW31_04010 [Candidatus Pacebacteria bacterium]|nr:hypothetical protein [Candidatus Paceibacterota bacterium]